MKKLLLIVCSLFYMASAYADSHTITMINSGKAGGSFNARTQMYKDGLEAAGYDVTFENIGKISQAVKMFKESTAPTVMVYSTNQVYKQNLFHTEENFVMLEYQQPLYICQTNASKNKTGVLTVAHGKGYDPKLLTDLLGTQVTLVPYKNSGAMLKGILGGDVDMMVNNQGKSFKYIKSGEGVCEASNVLPTMEATVIAKNVDIESLRETIYNISMGDAFVTYHTSKRLNRPSGTRAQELAIVQSGEKGYLIK